MDLLAELENWAIEAENEDNTLHISLINSHRPVTQLKAQKSDYTTTYLDLLPYQSTARLAILTALSDYPPTFIRVNIADKQLSSYSIAPSLGFGVDPTLPQYRVTNADHTILPAQNQCPVWYFFYGTLSDPEILAQKLSHSEPPTLNRATAVCGDIKTWGWEYKALIDGPSSAIVDGWAYEVCSEEEEEQFRYYETGQNEAVRCDILMVDSGDTAKGLTFSFIDDCNQTFIGG
ncbi:hypothetical protein BDV29DRAFT_161854 [Aspergillus leporis]|uniref:Gamma-glutamylcyclotransferase AIG2-like domain-containing protein n=1 Tax=Aspergillus leporis TaxID=41062 RepID=A0A5N5WP00_9EURO|nr:hypothetical protein BDV29DRAFT_161854 [Aspergillus leporis]